MSGMVISILGEIGKLVYQAFTDEWFKTTFQ